MQFFLLEKPPVIFYKYLTYRNHQKSAGKLHFSRILLIDLFGVTIAISRTKVSGISKLPSFDTVQFCWLVRKHPCAWQTIQVLKHSLG